MAHDATQPTTTGLLHRVAALLRARLDTEHEMTLNRVALTLIVTGGLTGASLLRSLEATRFLASGYPLLIGYAGVTLALFLHILWRPAPCAGRRAIAMVADIGVVSGGAFIGGATGAFLYPLYLWTIFGNGFRFGLRDLALAMLIGALGFGLVIINTPFWRANPMLAAGLLGGVALLPLYVSLLIRKLSEAKRQAEAANRAKSLFLASVSHELRTPLTAIIGLAALLRDTSLDREQDEMARTVGRSGKTLLGLIDAILDYSRLEAAPAPAPPEAVDLYALLSETRDMLAVEAQRKGVHLGVFIAPLAPRCVSSNARHLRDILNNLVGNAVKFTTQGSVVISLDARACAQADHCTLRFEVADTGIGVAPGAQARIFDEFTQADETILDRFGGTGLGLAIVKQRVEGQGGRIGVTSEPGKGSTFWFELDVRTCAAERLFEPAGLAVMVLSEDYGLFARLDQLGVDATRATSVESLAALLDSAAVERGARPIVLVDERITGGAFEPALRTTAAASRMREPQFILLADKDAPQVEPSTLARWFATTLARPLDSVAIARALEIAHDGAAGDREQPPRTRGAPLRVLVAEDNHTNQKVIAKILERAGHTPVTVENGADALAALAAASFDVVLMDVNMPVLNGIETTQRYHVATPAAQRTPIVALTADVTAECQARCAEAGMAGCLTKPVEPQRLIEIIERAAARAAVPAPVDRLAPVADSSAEPIDADALQDLFKLGGRAFVDEIVAQFTSDADTLIGALRDALDAVDHGAFRDHAHALRSCAANVGALGIYKLCLDLREISEADLRRTGDAHLAALARAVAAACDRLRDDLDGAQHAAAPSATSSEG